MTVTAIPRTVVIGASFAGLLAAAAASAAGHRVVVVERDVFPAEARSPRDGVPQGRQPHILLRRGLDAIESLLPGVTQDLVDRGGARFNTGRIPWLSEFGWAPMTDIGHDIVSLSRPLLESVVRERVARAEGVEIRTGLRVTGLAQTTAGWSVQIAAQEPIAAREPIAADVVVDASGRASRLPRWLADLGVDVREPSVVEAGLGYASRRYVGTVPLTTGVVVLATPADPRGGLALKVEDDCWLISAAGYGEHRPGRSEEDFAAALAALRDPALADLADPLTPVTDVAVHRQTANQRHSYGRGSDWPAGLLVVGDALCAFNPIYGQGITVAALEAELLRTALPGLLSATGPYAGRTRSILRRFGRLTELPWSVATGSDHRIMATPMSRRERLTDWWTVRLARLGTGGNDACSRAFADVYHLIGSPLLLFGPGVVAAVLRSLVHGVPAPARRPQVLEELADTPVPERR